MPERPRTYHDGEIVNVATKHETSDVNVKALLGFVVVFIVFAIITHIVLLLLFHHYQTIFSGHTNESLTAIERPAGSDVPAEPRLQPLQTTGAKDLSIPPTAATPVVDMETMRQNEDEALNNPGWVDHKAGRVRLPIDVAKQLVVQRGLPVNGAAGTTSTATSPAAAASTAGALPPSTSTATTPSTSMTGGATH